MNEMVIDNNHPVSPWVKLYLDNFPTDEEINNFISHYLKLVYKGLLEERKLKDEYTFVDEEHSNFKTEVLKLMRFGNWFWSLWTIMMLDVTKVNEDTFYIPYL